MPAQTTYLPAFGLFSSGVELLGRCINGNFSERNTTNDLKNGYKWLNADIDYNSVQDSDPIVTTMIKQYSAEDLANLRNYIAHGQAILKSKVVEIDKVLLGSLGQLLARGLGVYWNTLINDEFFCNQLALANILPFRNHPINKSWVLFEKDEYGKYHSVQEIFKVFNFDVIIPD